MKLTLPTDSADRKNYPLLMGFFRYFPAAIMRVARISKLGNDKHNPGEQMHHARGKSMDHGDCILRHTMDLEDIKGVIDRAPPRVEIPLEISEALIDEAAQRAWRSLADLQELCEKYGGAPLAPGAKVY
jgi:hypothetical protein